MITTFIIIVTILITLAYIIACMFGAMIFYLRVPVLIILIALIPIIIIKVFYRVQKYGSKNVFRVFQKCPEENEQLNLVEHILRKWNSVHYIYKIDDNIIIFLSRSGIYFIKVIDYYGNLVGNENDLNLTLKNETTGFVPNFFLQLLEKEKYIQTIIPNVPTQKIIVSKETCTIKVPYREKYLIIGIHNFYCQTKILEKCMSLSIAQVNEINMILAKEVGRKK